MLINGTRTTRVSKLAVRLLTPILDHLLNLLTGTSLGVSFVDEHAIALSLNFFITHKKKIEH